jgi:hypothetical protein
MPGGDLAPGSGHREVDAGVGAGPAPRLAARKVKGRHRIPVIRALPRCLLSSVRISLNMLGA